MNKQHGGTLLGLAFGLVVGVLVSFGVVWYLNKTPLPFVEKVSKPEGKEKPGEPVSLPGKPGDKPVAPPEKKFEFYDILEGKKPATPGAPPPPAAVTKAPATKEPIAKETPAVVTPAAGTLYLQAGAFQKASDADSLRGKLAMLGFEASVSEVEVPDKGLMRRVRVGPFADTEQMNRARSQLSQQGIPASVVRVKD